MAARAVKPEPRGVRASWELDIKPALRDPIGFVKGIPGQIAKDYTAATNPNIEGGYKTDVSGVDATGMPVRRPMAKAEIVKPGEEGSQSIGDWQAAARRTGINAATAPISLAKAAVRVPFNAALGALDSPGDRIRGATSGAVLGEAIARAPRIPGQVARATKRIGNRTPAAPPAPAVEVPLADLQAEAAAAKTRYDAAAWNVAAGDQSAAPAKAAAQAELGRLNAQISQRQRAAVEAPPPDPTLPEGVTKISPEEVAARRVEPVAPPAPKITKEISVDKDGLFFDARNPGGDLRPVNRVSTDGLIKAARELETAMRKDAEAAIYRNVETQSSGTQATLNQMASTKTGRGTSYQAEALQRLKNAQGVKDRIDAELKSRGLTDDDIISKTQEQGEYEQTVEAERLDYDRRQMEAEDAPEMQDTAPDFDRAETGDTSFDFGANKYDPRTQPREYLNLARTGLDRDGAALVREIVASGRASGTIDKGYRSFAEADAGAVLEKRDLLRQLVADPLTLDLNKTRNVSTDQIKAMWMVAGDNTKTIEAASRVMNDPKATIAEIADATELHDRAFQQTEGLISSIVTETAQKAREFGALRNIAKQSVDPEVWLVQAKRILKDKPLPDSVQANIRRLAREAMEACG